MIRRARSRPATQLLLLAAVVAIGCSRDSHPAVDSGTSRPATASAGAAPGTTAPDSAWRVTARGLGPVQIGATVAAVRSILGDDLAPPPPQVDSACSYLRGRGRLDGVWMMTVGGRVARIEVRGPGIATAAGARVRDREARVQALYAGQVAVTPQKYTSGHYLTVTPRAAADIGFRIVFDTDGQRVTAYRAGRLPEVEWVEGCG